MQWCRCCPLGYQQVGHVGRLETVVGKPLHQQAADPETAGIDQHDPAMAADQHDRAPAEPAVAHRLAGITLHQDVDLVAVDLHGLPASWGTGGSAGHDRRMLGHPQSAGLGNIGLELSEDAGSKAHAVASSANILLSDAKARHRQRWVMATMQASLRTADLLDAERSIFMNYQTDFKSLRDQVSPAEWQARLDLAACYRLVDQYDMQDLIYNHITALDPGNVRTTCSSTSMVSSTRRSPRRAW